LGGGQTKVSEDRECLQDKQGEREKKRNQPKHQKKKGYTIARKSREKEENKFTEFGTSMRRGGLWKDGSPSNNFSQ